MHGSRSSTRKILRFDNKQALLLNKVYMLYIFFVPALSHEIESACNDDSNIDASRIYTGERAGHSGQWIFRKTELGIRRGGGCGLPPIWRSTWTGALPVIRKLRIYYRARYCPAWSNERREEGYTEKGLSRTEEEGVDRGKRKSRSNGDSGGNPWSTRATTSSSRCWRTSIYSRTKSYFGFYGSRKNERERGRARESERDGTPASLSPCGIRVRPATIQIK